MNIASLRLVLGSVVVVLVAACASSDPAEPTTSRPSDTPTTEVLTTTITELSDAPPSDDTSDLTVASIIASVEAEYQAWWDYWQPEKPDGVVGPVEIECEEQGRTGYGDVLFCEAVPLLRREYYPDPFQVVIIVTGDDGSVHYGPTKRDVKSDYRAVGTGALCRDLLENDDSSSSYEAAVMYWFLDGRPDRMDADRDGIPCETVHSLGEIFSFWDGTPFETATAIHFGEVTNATTIGSSFELTIDYADFLGGMEANLAAEAVGYIQPGEGVPNDYFIRNENPRLRTFDLSPGVEVFLEGRREGADIQSTPVDPAIWIELVAEAGRCREQDWPPDCSELGGEDWGWYGSGGLPYWIQVEGNSVVRIEEQYLP